MRLIDTKQGRFYDIIVSDSVIIDNCVLLEKWFTNDDPVCFVRIRRSTKNRNKTFGNLRCSLHHDKHLMHKCRQIETIDKNLGQLILEFFSIDLRLGNKWKARHKSKRNKMYRALLKHVKNEKLQCYNKNTGTITHQDGRCNCYLTDEEVASLNIDDDFIDWL